MERPLFVLTAKTTLESVSESEI